MTISDPLSPPSVRKAPQSATAIVVDGNLTSRRFVELALGRAGFSVETASDGRTALETLKQQPVEIVVCDTDLPDMEGLDFFRRLSEESRLRSVPFVFLSADREVELKVKALQAGVDEYLVKPCDVAELVARATALVERQRKIRDALRSRTFGLAGDMSVVSFADIVNIVELSRRSGILSFVTPNTVGRLHFDCGELIHAVCGSLVGLPAFYRLFREQLGRFEFALGEVDSADRTITDSANALILEAARLQDTEAHSKASPFTTRPPPPDHALAVATSRTEDLRSPEPLRRMRTLMRGPEPNSMLAAQLELELRDPFALGELCLWSPERLAAWTSETPRGDRFHVHLVASLEQGVAAMLAVGAPPTERWVKDSLTPTPKAFGLTFYLRHDRRVDVVLIDVEHPLAMERSLHRVPSAMIVAPPRGSPFDLPEAAQRGLKQLIEALAPPALVGVGGDGLSQHLSEQGPVRRASSTVRCSQALLGDDGEDLRTLLIRSVRLWASRGASRP